MSERAREEEKEEAWPRFRELIFTLAAIVRAAWSPTVK